MASPFEQLFSRMDALTASRFGKTIEINGNPCTVVEFHYLAEMGELSGDAIRLVVFTSSYRPRRNDQVVNPLFIRTVAITGAHATPNASIIAGRSIAVCPSVTGMVKRNGGNAFSVFTGFSDGLRAQAFGNFGGSGAWSWNTSLMPKLDYQVYIETAYMD